jgi:hypothetical protein
VQRPGWLCLALTAVATAQLIGCAGGVPGHPEVAAQAGKDRSWMLPDARRRSRLLYVSDGSGVVYVYDYKSGEPAGKLTGFQYPFGQCVDKKGDVWITNFQGTTSWNTRMAVRAPLRRCRTRNTESGVRSIR